jgi:hypothetical protein
MNRDFAEMLSIFTEEGVEYLVVGAYAMAAHGWPRATGDIDLWVRPTRENAERVLRALRRFGAPLFDLALEDLQKTDTVFQIGQPPGRIDILSGVSGVAFDDAWAHRMSTSIEGQLVQVIGFDQLLTNKRASGRPKDLVDVMRLERTGRK